MSLGFGTDTVKIEKVQIEVSGHRPHIRSSGSGGDLAQSRFIELGQNQVARLVLAEAALSVSRGDRSAGGIAHAKDKDLDPLGGCLAGCFN